MSIASIFLVASSLFVGVTERCGSPDSVYVQSYYTEALVQAGHVPVVIPHTDDTNAIAAVLFGLKMRERRFFTPQPRFSLPLRKNASFFCGVPMP